MPFHQYFNGEILTVDTPVYKTNDLGLLRGYGLFDYFRTYNGIPFRWNDYWQRFENSAKLLIRIVRRKGSCIQILTHRWICPG
jgi:branched-chain amino acid aminotransferase